jgi:hypothetical protein
MFGAICAPGFLVGVGRMKVEAREDAREEKRRLKLKVCVGFYCHKKIAPCCYSQPGQSYIAVYGSLCQWAMSLLVCGVVRSKGEDMW